MKKIFVVIVLLVFVPIAYAGPASPAPPGGSMNSLSLNSEIQSIVNWLILNF